MFVIWDWVFSSAPWKNFSSVLVLRKQKGVEATELNPSGSL